MERDKSRRALRVGLGLLLFYGLFSSWLPGFAYISVFQAGTLLAAAVWAVRFGLGRSAPLGALLAFAIFPAIWGLIQIVAGWSVYEWKTWVAVLEWLTRACLVVLAAEAFSVAEPDREVPKWIALVSIAVSVLALFHWYTSPGLILWTIPDPYAVRVPFPLLNHAQYAALIELLLAPVIIGAISSATNARLCGWTAALMIASVFAVGSRAGAVIVTLETGAVMALAAKRHVFSSSRRRMAGLAIPTLLLIFAFGWRGIQERRAHPSRDDLRTFFAKSTVEMIQSRPLTGFGLGTWATVYPAFEMIDPGLYVDHAHSDWLEWAAEGGLPFVTLLLAVFVWSTYWAIQRPEYLGVVAVFLHATVDFPLHKPILAALHFAVLGILWYATRGKILNHRCTIQHATKK